MKMNSILLSGIAFSAVAAAMTFEAQAQSSAAPSTSQDAAAPSTGETMPSGDASTMPKKHALRRHRRSVSSHELTSAEKAATDQLNAQQLSQAGSPSDGGTMPMSSNRQIQPNMGTASPAPSEQSGTGTGNMNGYGNNGAGTAPNNSTVVPGSEPTMTAPQTGPQPVPNPNVPGNTPNQPSQTTPPPQ